MSAQPYQPLYQASACPENLNGSRIVLVDDEPGTTLLWSVILAQAGYKVIRCHNPASALKMIYDGCDLVITDYQMPGLSGAELIRRARPMTRAKFILLTGNQDREVAADAFAAGAAAVIYKPAEPRSVVALARSLCGRMPRLCAV